MFTLLQLSLQPNLLLMITMRLIVRSNFPLQMRLMYFRNKSNFVLHCTHTHVLQEQKQFIIWYYLIFGIVQMLPTTDCFLIYGLRKKNKRVLLFSLKSVWKLTLPCFFFKSLHVSQKVTSFFLALKNLTPS